MEQTSQSLLANRDEIFSSETTKTSMNWWGVVLIFLFCVSFLLVKVSTGSLLPINLVFLSLIIFLYFFHSFTRKFLIIGIPMAVYLVIFDLFRYIPFEWLKPIHVQDLFQVDKSLFGVSLGGAVIPLHKYLFSLLSHPFFDLLSGVVYFLHVPMVIILLFVFWRFRSGELAQRFTLAFLIMNILALLTFYFFASAAPWYVEKFGFAAPLGLLVGDPAGLARIDQLLGIDIFTSNYKIAPINFGAIPSMHVGFATLGWLFSFQVNRKLALFLGIYVVAMCFSAMYLQHHYMIDLVVGGLYALFSWLMIDKIFRKKVNSLNRSLWNFFYQDSAGTIFKAKRDEG